MFYIGQKVVALKTGRILVKGNEYEVTGIGQCSCGTVHITVNVESNGVYHCGCRLEIPCLTKLPYVGGNSKNFAPLETYRESYSIAIELVQELQQVDKQKIFNPKKVEI